ncbi:MAG: integrase [Hydrogenophilales bacterium 28-61-23]|nr:MAG: integrase [Hydrogenophilales bacterium 28-61-23]
MADIIVFQPKAELDAQSNLDGFIESCRYDLTIFGADLDFDAPAWDLTKYLERRTVRNSRAAVTFSTWGTRNKVHPESLAQPFQSFAKAYLRYMHGLRPTKIIDFRLAALRALEFALTENNGEANPVLLDASHFNRAAQAIGLELGDATAYRIGSQLEMVGEFLAENRLTKVPVHWKNYIKRPNDTTRVGKEADERRKEKLPSESALDALPKAFRLATNPADVIVTATAAILCSAPDRVTEVMTLPVDCEHWGKHNGKEVYGIRWWPAKGAKPMVKWVVPSMASVVQEALAKIRACTEEARRVAKWYEDHPRQVYLPADKEHLRHQEWLSMSALAEWLGSAGGSSASGWCERNDVQKTTREGSGRTIYARFSDIEAAIIRMLPSEFPVFDKSTGLRYSDALFVARINEINRQKGMFSSMVKPISIQQISDGLGARVEHGFPSVFSLMGFTAPDGSPIQIKTNQFRHYLNTLAQLGGMSQLDIAKWSGRKDIRQNAVYDHVSPDQMLQKVRDAIGDDSQMFGPLAELPKRVLIPRDEFARLLVPTAHTTDFGFCIHDYTMSPCQLHADCIHCQDLVCVKGDEERAVKLHRLLEEAKALHEQSLAAVDEGYAGSDRWMQHQKTTVERLTQLCGILDDSSVPNGAVIQLSTPNMASRITQAVEARLGHELSGSSSEMKLLSRLMDSTES